jgi:hypothetical protein
LPWKAEELDLAEQGKAMPRLYQILPKGLKSQDWAAVDKLGGLFCLRKLQCP